MSALERVPSLLASTGREWNGPDAPSVDPADIGASDGGRWTSADGTLEATAFEFGSQGEHDPARERLAALGMPGDATLPWGSNGALLYRATYVGPAEGAAQGQWDAMDVLSALAGGE
jgi:hypothetical protein